MLRLKNLPLIALIFCLLLPLLALAEKPDGRAAPDNHLSETHNISPEKRDGQGPNLEVYLRTRSAQSLGPNFLVVPPAAFTSDGASPDAFRIDADFGYLRGMHAPSSMWAPVYLPQDVVINSFEVRLEDWDAQPGHNVCIYLDRMNLESGEYECCLAELCSDGGDGEYVTLVENNISAPVVTDLYAYQINIYGLYPDTYIFGMRVGYGFEENLPAIMSD